MLMRTSSVRAARNQLRDFQLVATIVDKEVRRLKSELALRACSTLRPKPHAAVVGERACTNPVEVCVYDEAVDPCHECCLFCGRGENHLG
jgi:hypothetical protein